MLLTYRVLESRKCKYAHLFFMQDKYWYYIWNSIYIICLKYVNIKWHIGTMEITEPLAVCTVMVYGMHSPAQSPGSLVHQPQNGCYSTCFYLIFAVFASTVLVLCKGNWSSRYEQKQFSSSQLVYSEILVHRTLYSSQDHVLPNMLIF